MNGKELLDALGLVEDRFVQEAEYGRLPRLWAPLVGWLAAAACLCLVLMSGAYWLRQTTADGPQASQGHDAGRENVAETQPPAADGADGDPEVMLYGYQVVRTDGNLMSEKNAGTQVIRSKEELERYYQSNRETFDLERKVEADASHGTMGFLDACDRYDAAFFESRDLILLVLEEPSGSIQHQVQSIRPYGDGWLLAVRTIVPEQCTDDMAQWHILIEVEKNLVDQGDSITLEQVQ